MRDFEVYAGFGPTYDRFVFVDDLHIGSPFSMEGIDVNRFSFEDTSDMK